MIDESFLKKYCQRIVLNSNDTFIRNVEHNLFIILLFLNL